MAVDNIENGNYEEAGSMGIIMDMLWTQDLEHVAAGWMVSMRRLTVMLSMDVKHGKYVRVKLVNERLRCSMRHDL